LITDVLTGDAEGRTAAEWLIDYFRTKNIELSSVDGRTLLPLYRSLGRSRYTAQGNWHDFSDLCAPGSTVTESVWGVIVETRRHPCLSHIVQQFSNQLGIGIQLFHGADNEAFIDESPIADMVDQGKVILSTLNVETLPPSGYNSLLLSTNFWHAVRGREKILIFQTDAIICQCSDYTIEDFIMFDYIGANWSRERPIGITIDGGSGGLSLRDWKRTTECLGRFDPRQWPGGEDGYFPFHMELLGGRVSKPRECSRFATQNEFLERSFGAHKISELDAESLANFLDYCPDGRILLNMVDNARSE